MNGITNKIRYNNNNFLFKIDGIRKMIKIRIQIELQSILMRDEEIDRKIKYLYRKIDR